jgi:RNA polymerase sigma-70 factor (ECF subfamily)
VLLRRLDSVRAAPRRRFQGYLRQALFNRVRDEKSAVCSGEGRRRADPDSPGHDPSPLEEATRSDDLERYEAALGRLQDDDREAIILRVELGYSMPRSWWRWANLPPPPPTWPSARALVRLAKEMSHGRA